MLHHVGQRLYNYFSVPSNILFFVLTLLYLLPIWSIQFFPTQDGPSHVYNSFILKEYFNTTQYPLLQQYYDLNLQPMPNWFGHLVIASLMFIVDPLIAEKIMLSGYVILFLYAGRFLIIGVGRGSFLLDKSQYSFFSEISTNSLPLLLFPFVYNYLLHMGFYNFSYSVGFCLLAVGYWWDNHQKLGYKQAIVFNLIMVCCYFSHMVSTVITLIVVSILWLLTFRLSNLKKHLWQIPMLLPSCALPIWFIFSHGTKSNHVHWPIRRLYEYVSNLEILFSFTTFQLKLGKILSACFLLLLILTLLNLASSIWKKRHLSFQYKDGFFLISLVCIVLYVLVPDGMSGGGFISHRLSLYPFLFLIPFFQLPKYKLTRWVVFSVLILIALINFGYIINLYPKLDKDMKEFRSGLHKISPNSRVLPLIFDSRGQCQRIGMFLHAIGYYCAYTGGVEWDNYEANTDYFPILFNPAFKDVRPNLSIIETKPRKMKITPYVDLVDFIYTWSLPVDSTIQKRIEANYKLVFEKQRTRIYKRNLKTDHIN